MKRSKFSLSHYKLLTADMGKLYPLTWFEALPGDTIQHSTSMLLRAAPLVAPVMHPVKVRIHHWFVPLRLIWEDFEDFITGGEDGLDASVPPYSNFGTSTEGNLEDYMGVPPGAYGGPPYIKVSALPFRAYRLIWNEYYRDQDLSTEVTVSTASGADATAGMTDTVLPVCWEKDYFTASRPWEQKGEDVVIPLADSAPVVASHPTERYPTFEDHSSGNPLGYLQAKTGTPADVNIASAAGDYDMRWDDPGLEVDLTTATGIPVSELRLAMAVQAYQEARGMYGSRYVEYLRYLGVRSSDARLARPEYLGGGRQVIQFSEVLATADSGSYSVGDMVGHGISAMRTNRYRRFFEEHGIVMSLMSVLPRNMYNDGLHRSFSRETKEAFYQRELEAIGDQAILNKEVYMDAADPDDTFSYSPRYDEYRWLPSTIAGEFRSTLDHWHLARIFGSEPALNSTFVEAVPSKRVFASESTDCLYCMANHSIQARRMVRRFVKPRI